MEYHKFFSRYEKSIIIDLVYIELITIYTCICKYKSYSFQKMLDIPLLIQGDIHMTELERLLRVYFEKEIVEFEAKCENCQKILNHLKELN